MGVGGRRTVEEWASYIKHGHPSDIAKKVAECQCQAAQEAYEEASGYCDQVSKNASESALNVTSKAAKDLYEAQSRDLKLAGNAIRQLARHRHPKKVTGMVDCQTEPELDAEEWVAQYFPTLAHKHDTIMRYELVDCIADAISAAQSQVGGSQLARDMLATIENSGHQMVHTMDSSQVAEVIRLACRQPAPTVTPTVESAGSPFNKNWIAHNESYSKRAWESEEPFGHFSAGYAMGQAAQAAIDAAKPTQQDRLRRALTRICTTLKNALALPQREAETLFGRALEIAENELETVSAAQPEGSEARQPSGSGGS